MRIAVPLALAASALLALPARAGPPTAADERALFVHIASGGRPEVDRAIERIKLLGFPRRLMTEVAQLLLEGGPLQRQNAAYVFSVIPEARFADLLIRATQDEDEIVRERTCIALGRLRARGAVAALGARAADPSPVVRREAVKALGHLGDKAATPAVLAVLGDFNHETRMAAILALGALGDRRAEAKLTPLLKDPSETVRLAAAKSLAALGNAEGRKAVDALLLSKDPYERRDGIKLVEDVKAPWVREAMLGLMRDPELPVAIAAARALAGLGDGRGVEWLVHSAERVAPEPRLRIETALEELRLTSADRKRIASRPPSRGVVLPVVLPAVELAP